MNTLKNSAKIILEQSWKPLHYKEITRLALEQGLFETSGKTPDATINSQIILDIKHNGWASDFIKTAPSIYAINPTKKTPLEVIDNVIKKEEIEKIEEEKEKIESGFTGKGWEHLVCSELLFRGYNASIMSVDVGMDIVATKWNNLISIQVKTSNLNKFDTYLFDVRKVSFERHSTSNVYYIFVLHGELNNDYLILPFFEMEKKIKERALIPILNDTKYRVRIMKRNGHIYLWNMNFEVDYYKNNWSIIK